MRQLPELLCPAGDEDALRAAVDCGADAVYVGYKAYGARASAVNFDDEALERAVGYAHLYHARVHVTVNTLVKEGEFEGVAAALQSVARAGADAVIVQDLGVARLSRDEFPSLGLHASTQMALSNATDARFARDFGFDRVVLARECSLAEVRKVVETGLETEIFAHGALCSSVSGRCLMSSMAGGRSGNRGRCAQPCRMRVSLNGREGALLSLRDLCTLQDLPALCDAGVRSLKIEGRLKSAEYVAEVTDVYRRALDDVALGVFDPDDPAPRERLLQIFNRGGFTRGHLMGAQDAALCAADRVGHAGVPLGEVVAVSGQLASVRVERALHNGDSLQLRGREEADLRYSGTEAPKGEIATLRLRPDVRARVGDRVARLSDAEQLARARSHAPAPIFITMRADFALDRPMRLLVSDGVTQAVAEGGRVKPAQSRAATPQDARRQLAKLGETPFSLQRPGDLCLTLEEGLFLPVSELNALRRAATDELVRRRAAAFASARETRLNAAIPSAAEASALRRGCAAQSPPLSAPKAGGGAPLADENTLAVCFTDVALARPLLQSGANLLAFEPLVFRPDALCQALAALPPGTFVKLPAQMDEETLAFTMDCLRERAGELGGVMASSFGQLTLASPLPVLAGDALPVTNRRALAALMETPARAFTLWPEWTFAEQRAFAPYPLPALMKLYGREGTMLLNHCPYRALKGLCDGRESCRLCAEGDMACGQRDAAVQDQKGYRFPLRRTVFPKGCALSLLNALPTDLRAFDADRRALGAGALLCFTVETREEQLAITASVSALMRGDAPAPPLRGTAGHWRRGVE